MVNMTNTQIPVLTKLAEKLLKKIAIICLRPGQPGGTGSDWKLANVMSTDKKDRKEDPENYRLSSLTSMPGKAMEQMILSAIM